MKYELYCWTNFRNSTFYFILDTEENITAASKANVESLFSKKEKPLLQYTFNQLKSKQENIKLLCSFNSYRELKYNYPELFL